jgi:hypothetical protein
MRPIAATSDWRSRSSTAAEAGVRALSLPLMPAGSHDPPGAHYADMRSGLLLALTLAAGCGARTDLLVDSDGGYAPQTTSTGTGSGATETAIGTASETSTETCEVNSGGETCTLPTMPISDLATSTGTATGASCMISASNYEQECEVDAECMVVPTGNFCVIGTFECADAISTLGLALYSADVAMTPARQNGYGYGCAVATPPCCRQGQCTTSCQSDADTLPACAMAGGLCLYGATCSNGPGNSCAYSDESCCLEHPTAR